MKKHWCYDNNSFHVSNLVSADERDKGATTVKVETIALYRASLGPYK